MLTLHERLALQSLKEGNERFEVGAPAAGKLYQSMKTQLIFVLGHTNCGAIKGATAAYFAAKKQQKKAAQF